jgi:hypothetical protein
MSAILLSEWSIGISLTALAWLVVLFAPLPVGYRRDDPAPIAALISRILVAVIVTVVAWLVFLAAKLLG